MMQRPRLAVFTASAELFREVSRVVPSAMAEVVQVVKAEGEVPGGLTMALVDAGFEGGAEPLLEKLAARAVHAVLVDEESRVGDAVPEALHNGLADDILLLPLRPVELLGKLKHAAHLARVNELVTVNSDLKTLIGKFEEDIRVARSIQRSLIPEKFGPVPGLNIRHKYLSGLKSGGDYMDLFELGDGTHVGILMSDSSGYGLSSAFLSVLLKVAVKLSRSETRRPSLVVAGIFEEIKLTMKPGETLSIFYGILNRKTFEMVYTRAGNIGLFHQPQRRLVARPKVTNAGLSSASEVNDTVAPAEALPPAPALSREEPPRLADQSLDLVPGDRMVVLSDGFGDAFGGPVELARVLETFRAEEPIAVVNEMTYRIRKGLESDDDMPAQDCSVMVLDVEKRAIRLAR